MQIPLAFWKARRSVDGLLEVLMGIIESPQALLCFLVWEVDEGGGCGVVGWEWFAVQVCCD